MGLMSLEDATKGQLKKRNNGHFMLVDGMSKLLTEQVKTCRSSDFHVSGLKWNLHIRTGTVEDHLSFYLWITDRQCIGSNWEVKCSYTLRVVSQIGPDIFKSYSLCFRENCTSWGHHNFISIEDLKERYIVDDKAVFCVEITDVKPSFPVLYVARTMGTAERIKLMEVPRNNSRFTWKITQFSSFNGNCHSSYEFTAGPRRWKLEMYPTGDSIDGYMSLFLTATDYVTNGLKGTTLAVYKLRVLDQFKRNHHETKAESLFPNDPDPKKRSWGIQKFLPLEELYKASRGLLVNDEIYIGVEFLIVSTSEYL